MSPLTLAVLGVVATLTLIVAAAWLICNLSTTDRRWNEQMARHMPKQCSLPEGHHRYSHKA